MLDETIIQIISSLGFPIVMCLLLYYNMVKQDERHEQETNKLRDTIDGNTKVLTELSTLIKTLVK